MIANVEVLSAEDRSVLEDNAENLMYRVNLAREMVNNLWDDVANIPQDLRQHGWTVLGGDHIEAVLYSVGEMLDDVILEYALTVGNDACPMVGPFLGMASRAQKIIDSVKKH